MSQYAFPLKLPPVFLEDNFCVSDCNRDAWQWIARWPGWPQKVLLLHGPSGSGKSHLGHIWAGKAKAASHRCREGKVIAPDAVAGNTLLEDIDAAGDEKALLHILNIARESGWFLLLTSALPPGELPFALPDLASRIKSLHACVIAPPDDDALDAALRKQFADRQLKVEDDVVAFLLPRLERSFAGLAAAVDTLDRKALAEQRRLTVPFVKRALGY